MKKVLRSIKGLQEIDKVLGYVLWCTVNQQYKEPGTQPILLQSLKWTKTTETVKTPHYQSIKYLTGSKTCTDYKKSNNLVPIYKNSPSGASVSW